MEQCDWKGWRKFDGAFPLCLFEMQKPFLAFMKHKGPCVLTFDQNCVVNWFDLSQPNADEILAIRMDVNQEILQRFKKELFKGIDNR